ncbi:hypothetical protein D3C84_995760 [compost metagenome]
MVLFRLRCGVPHVIRAIGADRLAHLGQHQHRVTFTRAEVFQVQRHAQILAHMKRPGQQQGRCRCGQQALGHASVTLLLHGEHRRHLRFGQQAAMGLADVVQ